MNPTHALLFVLLTVLSACASSEGRSSTIRVAHLEGEAGEEFEELRRAFSFANPGYDVQWYPACASLEPSTSSRVLFVQGPAERSSAPTVGDILLLPEGDSWHSADGSVIDLLAFEFAAPLPPELPTSIRPDWDPLITDTPGGCAEETGAYRRILLTWLEEKGPYVLHALNAHRVRITDSFSHYHPLTGGFDELYLVQMASPESRVLTSESVAAIEQRSVTEQEAAGLIQEHVLKAGDLVYLPRGTMHRGVGGALVQVISVPGFVPNSEIGLDHHLHAINEGLGLEGESALPVHASASQQAVIK